jgi:hypothetical protein
MSTSTFWRAAAIQAASVAAISVTLAAALPRSFFEDWGWLAGPGAWAFCAIVTARVLALPLWPALGGAALAGIPSLLAVFAGVHWLGAVVAVAVFAAWCARLPRGEAAWTSA